MSQTFIDDVVFFQHAISESQYCMDIVEKQIQAVL